MILSDDDNDDDDEDDDNNDDDDDYDYDDDNNNNNNMSAELFCKPKEICAFHANFATARQATWRMQLASSHQHAEPHTISTFALRVLCNRGALQPEHVQRSTTAV
jgi:hypothetical protein